MSGKKIIKNSDKELVRNYKTKSLNKKKDEKHKCPECNRKYIK